MKVDLNMIDDIIWKEAIIEWNSNADEYNQWSDLSIDEWLDFYYMFKDISYKCKKE